MWLSDQHCGLAVITVSPLRGKNYGEGLTFRDFI